ncbi:MAG: HEPN domain-containing protein [Bacteroidia bacterium]
MLINNRMWNAAVNRLYYACFYAVNALLIKKQIQARKHSGIIQMFNLHFIHTGLLSKEYGKFYTTLFDMRQSGDHCCPVKI